MEEAKEGEVEGSMKKRWIWNRDGKVTKMKKGMTHSTPTVHPSICTPLSIPYTPASIHLPGILSDVSAVHPPYLNNNPFLFNTPLASIQPSHLSYTSAFECPSLPY